MITGGPGTYVARERLRALREGFARRGLPIDEQLLRLESFETDYAERQTQILLSDPAPPTAILSLGARLLPGILSALKIMGKSYPEDVSLICSNDTEIATIATPAITAVRYDAMALGRLAAEVLIEQIEGRLPSERKHKVEIASELVLRNSCRALRP